MITKSPLILLIVLLIISCNRDREPATLLSQVDSLKAINARLTYSVDSLQISLEIERKYSLQLEKRRQQIYYNPPIRNDNERRSWFTEYLRAKRDTIVF